MGRAKRKAATQATMDAFVGGSGPHARVQEGVQYKVPFLPLTAPETPTPAAFRAETPLFEHQRRSLHRMLQIESRDDAVARFNFGMLDYYSKGGCLADAIGMGKTATMLALIVDEPRDPQAGGNLLVAPSHLLAQWKHEAHKFVRDGELDVVVGLREYMSLVAAHASGLGTRAITNRTLVLVGVDEAVKSAAHWYKYGKLYPRELRGAGRPMHVDPVALQDYEEAAKFVHKAYCGPLWVSHLHFPVKPWRRTIFEEVQDLVLPGKEAQDCFIQLTHRCANVWLITATPFPAQADSIYANNQLLGFKRLRLQAHDPVFDEIKRKLYLRNCAQVKQLAITDKIKLEETYIPVELHPKELLLYKVERILAAGRTEYDLFALGDVDVLAAGGKEGAVAAKHESGRPQQTPLSDGDALSDLPWSEQYRCARQSCVHVGLSDRILDREYGGRAAGGSASASASASAPLAKIKMPMEIYREEKYHLTRQLAVAQKRKHEVDVMEAATRNTVAICRAIGAQVYSSVAACFAEPEASGLSVFFNDAGETPAGFRMLYRHYDMGVDMPEPMELLLYDQREVEDYVRKHFDSKAKVARLCSVMESTLNERCPRARAVVEDQLQQLTECVALKDEQDALDARGHGGVSIPSYGSKVAALLQYLRRLPKIKVVLFTMWTNALRVVEKALRVAGVSCAVFLQHQSSETKSAHVASFHTGETEVLLLNALTSASGINLQVASHVIFLDPVGYSATQASTLEQQAIGRVLRMGQTNGRVSVVRFVAEDTMEAALYDDIYEATAKVLASEDSFFDGKRDGDDAYVCADFAAPVRRVVRMVAAGTDAAEGEAAEDEEVDIVGSMSVEEAISHRLEKAAAGDEVLDLTEGAEAHLAQQLAAARALDKERERKRPRTDASAPALTLDDIRVAKEWEEPFLVPIPPEHVPRCLLVPMKREPRR